MKMKILSLTLLLLPFIALAEDSFVFTFIPDEKPSGRRIEGDVLHSTIRIQKIETPKALSIRAFYQGLQGRAFKIQVDLDPDHKMKHVFRRWGWVPMFKLDNEVLMDNITVDFSEESRDPSSISITSSDPESIRRWCRELGVLFGIPDERIQIDLTKKPNKASHGNPH